MKYILLAENATSEEEDRVKWKYRDKDVLFLNPAISCLILHPYNIYGR